MKWFTALGMSIVTISGMVVFVKAMSFLQTHPTIYQVTGIVGMLAVGTVMFRLTLEKPKDVEVE